MGYQNLRCFEFSKSLFLIMSGVSRSSSGQELHPELLDVIELSGSSPSWALSLACARIPVTLQSLMLPLSYLWHMWPMSEVSSVVHLEPLSSDSSRGFWCSQTVKLWFISNFVFSLCSLLLLQHRIIKVVGFSSS
jgi:hypothetical protein